jgi:hypothetical protein
MNFKILRLISLLLLTAAIPLKSQLVINEIMAANAGFEYDPDYYNFSDWVEIKNTGSSAVNLEGYYLSDELGDLKKWKFPSHSLAAGAYYVVYCDKEDNGRHTSFALRAEGEIVYLSDEGGSILSIIDFGQQYPDISYGRDPAEADRLLYCATPTPGSGNLVTDNIIPGPRVQYSIPAGRLEADASLSLSGNVIRYTTNYEEPGPNSLIYSEPIRIDRTMAVRSRTYDDGFLPGETYANTYFLDEHEFTLPVVALSFKDDHFYDDQIGIHVRGSNGVAGYCGDVANWYQDWERPAYFEYFDENGVKQISQMIGVKMAGGCTRGRDQKAMSLYARGKYGTNNFDYAFFKEKPDINSFPSLLLRNSGNDQDQTLLRDAFLQALVKGSMDMDFQAYQPVIVYFNGWYRGIYNLREKTNEDYVVSNYFLDESDIDMLERDREIIQGTAESYTSLVDFLDEHSLAEDDKYQIAAGMFDVQEYINWLCVHLYIGDRDWPGNNHKFWKEKVGGRWRWIMFDLDYGFGFRMDSDGYKLESFERATDPNSSSRSNAPWSTLLFRKLLENDGFEKKFLSTYLTHVYSSFEPEWCNYVLDSLSSVIDFEIYYNQRKWGRSKSQWLDFLSTLEVYAENRHGFMPGYVKEYFNLSSDPVNLVISNPDTRKGKVKVNEATIQAYPLDLHTYSELPMSIVAVPGKGFRFSHWKDNSSSTTYSESLSIVSDSSLALDLEPVFEEIGETSGIHLNELADISFLFQDEFGENSGFIELYNSGDSEALMYSFFLSDDRDRLCRYAIPDSSVIPAGGFLTFYTDGEARQGSMHTDFRLDRDGEKVYLTQKVGYDYVIKDSAVFEYLGTDASYGRYEDGTGDWRHMSVLTPGRPNESSGLGNDQVITETRVDYHLYPNPTAGDLFIALEKTAGAPGNTVGIRNGTWSGDSHPDNRGDYYADLIDISGKVVYPRIWLNSSRNHLDIGMLDRGLYIVRIFRDESMVHTARVILMK